jgi:L-galactose dehydrogenase
MEFTTLGRTGLKVSVAGLGCGGSSRLGLTAGHSEAHCASIILRAVELGVNLIDTAKVYGTEPVVGAALKSIPRESVVVSTKQKIANGKTLIPADEVVAGLNNSLKILGTDYVAVFFLHTVLPDAYEHAANVIVPALLREKEKGKFRFLGITEMPPKDARHEMLQSALKDDYWDVLMFAFHMLGQNARQTVFPVTQSRNIGTLIMFAVRSLFSTPGRLQQDIQLLAAAGQLPSWLAEKSQPLDFLLHEGGAPNIIEAAYRYARHEPGANVVLFGTSNLAHVEHNIKSILASPLPPADVQKINALFGNLEGVGLDEPAPKP